MRPLIVGPSTLLMHVIGAGKQRRVQGDGERRIAFAAVGWRIDEDAGVDPESKGAFWEERHQARVLPNASARDAGVNDAEERALPLAGLGRVRLPEPAEVALVKLQWCPRKPPRRQDLDGVERLGIRRQGKDDGVPGVGLQVVGVEGC